MLLSSTNCGMTAEQADYSTKFAITSRYVLASLALVIFVPILITESISLSLSGPFPLIPHSCSTGTLDSDDVGNLFSLVTGGVGVSAG